MKAIVSCILFSVCVSVTAQFTRRDSLQGGNRPERSCYDVLRYDLNITLDPDKRFISGYNDITFKTVNPTSRIQLDLFPNMNVDSIVLDKKKLTYKRDEGAVFIDVPNLETQTDATLRFYYSGNPLVAKNAPWDGGFVFSKDRNGKHWIATAVQGTGASLWYPVKDCQWDEPDRGARISVAVPDGLMNVSNGKLLGTEKLKGYTRWNWEVVNPINNYNISLNIGDYVLVEDRHNDLELQYWVLRGNEEKARKHFVDVKPLLTCFEEKFGKYPFTEDSFKLVETPFLGMEHQSAIAYGNQYRKGYLGTDPSGTGIGLRFDYIVVHEAGHEWFGNSITSEDIADMWIHEGFTTYAETVFIECLYGYDEAMRYINGQKMLIANDKPVIGEYGVNYEGSIDMYYKGSLMINTIRHIINDDSKWWTMLNKFATDFRHKIVKTEDVVSFFNRESGINLTPVFDQYLRTTQIPELVIEEGKGVIRYKWDNVISQFNMPVDIAINSEKKRITPTTTWQELKVSRKNSPEITVFTNRFLIR